MQSSWSEGDNNMAYKNPVIFINFILSMPQLSGPQGELLRRQNGERIQLEKDLAKEETDAIDNMLYDSDNKQRQITESMAESLALKLQGIGCILLQKIPSLILLMALLWCEINIILYSLC